ncbi:hypothetical protein EVG20_g1414 [Dentipellis fragilis]|uniref:Uncharacterized protein n=1 Tax=Dentipellis fragilis TaxID=205917 RepID=A0A4Y9ZCT9_9AGAM|nr:hypothetical protein EVG20_g1414 [Dentipellis fragilis]
MSRIVVWPLYASRTIASSGMPRLSLSPYTYVCADSVYISPSRLPGLNDTPHLHPFFSASPTIILHKTSLLLIAMSISRPRSHRPAPRRTPENNFPTQVSSITPAVDPPLPVKILASKNVVAEYSLGKFRLYRFPTNHLQGHIPISTWDITVTDDFGSADIDATQSLFAWVEYDYRSTQGEAPRRGMKVHMVDLTNGGPHQLAYEPRPFSRTMPYAGIPIFSRLVIAGDFIAVGTAYSRGGGTNHISPLIVFNWKTGDLVLAVNESWLFDFCFLDDRHILLYSVNLGQANRQDALLVYKLGARVTQAYAFLMPKTTFAKSVHPILKSSFNRPSSPDALIGVHVCHGTLTRRGMEVEGSIDILFRASSLKERIAACAQPRRFAWAEWGPSDTQTTKVAYRNPEVDSNFLTGMRAIDLVKGADNKMCLSIRDFDRDRIAQARLRGGNSLLEGVVVESCTIGAGVWNEGAMVTTRLPFVHRLVPLTNEKLRNINENYSWTVTEDVIILYDALESKRHIRVLQHASNPQ